MVKCLVVNKITVPCIVYFILKMAGLFLTPNGRILDGTHAGLEVT